MQWLIVEDQAPMTFYDRGAVTILLALMSRWMHVIHIVIKSSNLIHSMTKENRII